MSRRRAPPASRRPAQSPDGHPDGHPGGAEPPSEPDADRAARLRGRAAGRLASLLLGPFLRLLAAFLLLFGALALTIAWQAGPQPLLDARAYSTLTARADGRIVEAWLAVHWDPAEQAGSARWHARAAAAPCVIVAYAGDWGTDARRAFCGNRFQMREESALETLDHLTPEVPFEWTRDGSGFFVPEIRLGEAEARWLAANPPPSTFRLGLPEPRTALEALQRQLDHPVEIAIRSRAAPPRPLALALDPADPERALPAAYVEARRRIATGPWVLAVVVGAVGVFVWLRGIALLLPSVPPRQRALLGLLPLLTMPWWSERFPDALHGVDKDLAQVAATMFGDVDRTGRLIASEPAQAAQSGGVRLRFGVADGAYGATFGRVAFAPPSVPARDADTALAALAASAGAQAASFPEPGRVELLQRLAADKRAGRPGAGLVFVPWALAVLVDPASPAELVRAARGFLTEWTTQPIEEPWPQEPGFGERVRIFAALARAPVPEIANMARGVVERAAARR